MKTYLSYIIVFLAIAALIITGCGNSSDFIVNKYPEYISSKSFQISNEGGLDAQTPSGLRIKAEPGTFDKSSDIKVNITENKSFEGMSPVFSNTTSLYTISAEKTETSSLGVETKTKVTNVNKAVIITVPNNSTQRGIYYVGSRADENQTWKYKLVNDNNAFDNPLPIFSRASVDPNTKEFYVSTYNVDFQFSVFVETEVDPSKTIITDFTTEAIPSEYELTDGHYKDNLTVKASIFGDNLGKLNSGNFVVEIGFLNNENSEYNASTFPITGANAKYEVSAPDSGAGNMYKHTITLTDISDYSSNTLSFGIGATKLTQQVFPADFTITVRVEGTGSIVPFEDTKPVKLINKTSMNYIKVVSTSPEAGATNVSDKQGIITVKFDKELSADNNWDSFVSLTSANSIIPIDVSYADKTLSIKYNGLMAATSYKLKVNPGLKGVEPDAVTEAIELPFTTVSQSMSITASMQAPQTEGADVESKVVIAFSDNINWDSDLERLVTLSQEKSTVVCDYSYSSANKTLTLTPSQKLLFGKTYTVKVSKFVADMEQDYQFEFTTVESAETPAISPDTSKSIDGRFYLVADQKFHINFNKAIINKDSAKYKIYMKKNGADFRNYSLEFTSEDKAADINVYEAFEQDAVYAIGVNEFTDADGVMVKATEKTFEALKTLVVESVEIDKDGSWITASGSTDIALAGKIKVKLNQNVEPSYVKLIDKNGNEITGSQVFNKTAERSDTIEFEYRDLECLSQNGIVVSWVDPAMGMNFVSEAYTFVTTYPDYLVLQDPSQPCSETNPYLIYCAKALDQIRESDYLAKGYWFKQMADIDLDPNVYHSDFNTLDTGWKPFGEMTEGSVPILFIGNYDGNGKTISNLTCNTDIEDENICPSLFGAILNGSVSNLTLKDIDINGGSGVAGIVSYAESTNLTSCHVSGKINGTDHIGGLVAFLTSGNITDCDSDNLIIRGSSVVGGLVGHFGMSEDYDHFVATMVDCHSDNIDIEVLTEDDIGDLGIVGGVVGINCGKITNCYSSGKVISNKCNISGVVGQNGYYDTVYNPGGDYYYGYVESARTSCEVKGYDCVCGVIGFNENSDYDYDNLHFEGDIEPDFIYEPDPSADPPYDPWAKDPIVYAMPA